MRIRYANYQDGLDPLNSTVVAGRAELIELLDARRNNAPFFARFSCDNGFQIMMGVGRDLGCAQYSSVHGRAPFLMGVSHRPLMRGGYIEFLAGDTPTAIAARYILSFEELKTVALYFLETGGRSDRVFWRELDPKAVREDAARGLHLH